MSLYKQKVYKCFRFAEWISKLLFINHFTIVGCMFKKLYSKSWQLPSFHLRALFPRWGLRVSCRHSEKCTSRCFWEDAACENTLYECWTLYNNVTLCSNRRGSDKGHLLGDKAHPLRGWRCLPVSQGWMLLATSKSINGLIQLHCVVTTPCWTFFANV